MAEREKIRELLVDLLLENEIITASQILNDLKDAGFAIVPIKPTGEMERAGAEVYAGHEEAGWGIIEAYTAMIKAAQEGGK